MTLGPEIPGVQRSGSLVYTPNAVLIVEPGMGIDLAVDLKLNNTGTSPVRVDLSRSRISVDGVPFQTCRFGSDSDPNTLVANLAPATAGVARVTCKDIQRPVGRVEFKFGASGTGDSGELTVGFVGLGERL